MTVKGNPGIKRPRPLVRCRGWSDRGLCLLIGGFLQLVFSLCLFGRGFRVGHIPEHLQASGILFGREHPVLFVDGYSYQGFELAGISPCSPSKSTAAPRGQTPAAGLPSGRRPRCVHRNRPRSPWAGASIRTIAMLSERTDEFSISIEYFHSVVHGVGDVHIAIFIQATSWGAPKSPGVVRECFLPPVPICRSSLRVSASYTMTWSCCVSTAYKNGSRCRSPAPRDRPDPR